MHPLNPQTFNLTGCGYARLDATVLFLVLRPFFGVDNNNHLCAYHLLTRFIGVDQLELRCDPGQRSSETGVVSAVNGDLFQILPGVRLKRSNRNRVDRIGHIPGLENQVRRLAVHPGR